MDSPELRLIAPLVGAGAIPEDRANASLQKWVALQKAGKTASLLAVFHNDGLLTKTQCYVLARADLVEKQPFPNYRLLRLVGEGGMALVYEATYLPLKTRVALKVLDTAFALQEKYRLRFEREAKILLHLDHPNIVGGREGGRVDGIDYCAMGFVEGISVLDLLEKGVKISELLALQITAQVAGALEHMREQGVVHRDIKPGNLVLDHDGTVRIIDFGLAKLMTGMRADTTEETTVGTLEYMSPEQARGRADVDARADQYSLGCTLFQMVTGDLPFKGSASEVMFCHVKKDVDFTDAQCERVRPPLQYLIRTMMAKEPDDRYPTPRALLDDLKKRCGDVTAQPVDVPAIVRDATVESAPVRAPSPRYPPRPGTGDKSARRTGSARGGSAQRGGTGPNKRGGGHPPRRGR